MPSAASTCLGPAEGLVCLPVGFVDVEGALHREVELAPITGRQEEFLGSVSSRTSSASVITHLLAQCVRRIGNLPVVDAALIRRLSVSDREFLILKLWQITNGNRLRVTLPCQSEACGKSMQIDLSLAEIPIHPQSTAGPVFSLDVDDENSLQFRLPTGEDQEALAEQIENADCVEQLLQRCILLMPSTLDLEKVRAPLEQRMEELTPRPVLEVEGICPECGLVFSSVLDLTEQVLLEAAEQSQRLPYEVHRLAWHYHWSEGEIVSMPRRKRSRYLHLLDNELEQMNTTY